VKQKKTRANIDETLRLSTLPLLRLKIFDAVFASVANDDAGLRFEY